jgi:hypothetical protein
MKEWVLYVMTWASRLSGYPFPDSPPRSPSFTAPTSCLRAPLPARSLSLLWIVGSIIRSVTARVERGFADFAQIPCEDDSYREFCKFLDEFEGERIVLVRLEPA